jgi:hypothetical protein
VAGVVSLARRAKAGVAAGDEEVGRVGFDLAPGAGLAGGGEGGVVFQELDTHELVLRCGGAGSGAWVKCNGGGCE